MNRLTIFAKGNVDVRDTLVAHRSGGVVAWNGINEALRAARIPAVVRVRHETFTRSDALLAATGAVPPSLADKPLALGAYPTASQFSRALFDSDADAYVFSMQPEVHTTLLRHRTEGFLFLPREWESWDEAAQAWLRETFVPCPLLEPAESMANFARIVQRLRERSDAPVLVYNLSSVMPGDRVHSYQGLGETFATRARRFNLALVDLSRETGISIIDVDNIVARIGADRAKLDHIHLAGQACRAVAEEVVRVLVDLSVLPQGASSQ